MYTYICLYNYVFTGPLKRGRGDINDKLHTDKVLNNNTIAEYINLWLLRVSATVFSLIDTIKDRGRTAATVRRYRKTKRKDCGDGAERLREYCGHSMDKMRSICGPAADATSSALLGYHSGGFRGGKGGANAPPFGGE